MIVDPQVHVSTAEMYAAGELTRNCPAIKICSPQPGALGNVFEEVARKRYSKINDAFVWLESLTAVDKPFLTGSGACIVAPFVDRAFAQAHQKDCPSAYRAYVVKGYNRSPLAELVGTLEEQKIK